MLFCTIKDIGYLYFAVLHSASFMSSDKNCTCDVNSILMTGKS